MHEMALMGDIVDIVWQDASRKGIRKVNKIDLLVGELSQAMPDALLMAFEIYKEQYASIFSDGAELVIHHEEAIAKCCVCEHEYRPDRKITICPQCGIPTGNLISGEAFQVQSYEGGQSF